MKKVMKIKSQNYLRKSEKYSNNIVLFKYHILYTNVHSCTFSLILEHNKFL